MQWCKRIVAIPNGNIDSHVDNAVKHQQNTFFLPYSTEVSPKARNTMSGEQLRLKSITEQCSDNVENVLDCLDSEAKTKTLSGCRQSAEKPHAKKKVIQNPQKARPENEFRRATVFILLALFICYVPTIGSKFYLFATGYKRCIVNLTVQLCLISNSSLNAIILKCICNEKIDIYFFAFCNATLYRDHNAANQMIISNLKKKLQAFKVGYFGISNSKSSYGP